MKTYTLFWLDGKSEIVKGESISTAFSGAGYGAGAIRALDFFKHGDARDSYTWNSELRKWEMVELKK